LYVLSIALTIAGSDPSGGAGIQADLKTFHQFGVYGEAVITLVTVQNTKAVTRVELLSPDLVAEQGRAVLTDIPPAAVKTGALGSAEIVSAVASLCEEFSLWPVVDPVMISKHGARLMSSEAADVLKRILLPHAALVTPNLPEAEWLTGMSLQDERSVRDASHVLLKTGCRAVLIKGGHSEGEPVDYLATETTFTAFPGKRVATRHTHGTGCTYAAAITACLALGHGLTDAVRIAKQFIQDAIETAPGLGKGCGPVNAFAPAKLMLGGD
jgi:hydroxymethylpyrimidine/phosphomethylpyrimidine kinase